MGRRVLLYSPDLGVLEGEFLRRVTEGGPFRAIVPTRAWAERLDRELLALGLCGLCDSPVLTFKLTVDWALRRAGERDTRASADEPMRLLLMKVAVQRVYKEAKAGGKFAPLAPFAGFASWMASISTLLKEARISAEMLLDAGAELRRGNLTEVAQILLEYKDLLSRLEVEEEEDAYLRLVREVPPSRLPRVGRLFVLGFHDLTELQFAVLERLSESAEETIFLFPFDPGREELFEFALPTFERLSEFCDEVRPLNPGLGGERALSRLRRSFLSKPERGVPDDSLALIETSGATQEVEAVAREIRELRSSDRSLPWSEFAVIYRSAEPYLELIEEVFPRYSIPIDASEGPPLRSTGPGKAFVHLLLGRAQNYDRELILSALKSGYVHLSAPMTEVLDDPMKALDELDIHLREQGVTKGKGEWLEGLRRAVRKLEGEAEEAQQAGEEGVASVLRARAEVIKGLERELEEVLMHLAEVPERATWPEMIRRIASSIRSCISVKKPRAPFSPRHLARDLRAEEALDKMLGSLLLASRAAGEVETTISECAGLISSIVARIKIRPSSTKGDAVKVLDVEGSRGHRAGYVFVLGLLENSFPADPISDPFVPDGDREEISRRYRVKLPLSLKRPREEDLFFFLVTQVPRERLYLCYPATDPEGRPNVASRYVEEALGVVGPEGVRKEEGTGMRRISLTVRDVVPRRPGEVLPSVEASFCAEEARVAALLLAHEAEGEWALRWATQFLASDTEALDGLSVELARLSSKGPCEWSGAVGMTPLVAERWNAIFFEGMSPTALEEFGKCPFLYFVQHVVGAKGIEEAGIPISFKERGLIIHRILADFMRRRAERGALPLSRSELEGAKAELIEVAEEHFRKAEEEGRVGHPDVWRVERERIKQFLLCVLEGEPSLQRGGMIPRHVEVRFGVGKEEMPAPHVELGDGTKVPLRGVIDRLDVAEGGDGGFRVIDYKTGGERSPSDVRRGKDFQLWAYIKAARLMTGAEPKEAFYLLVTKPRRAGGARTCVRIDPSEERGRQLLEEAEAKAKEHLLRIREGLFPPKPAGESECRSCPYRRICRFDRLGRGVRA